MNGQDVISFTEYRVIYGDVDQMGVVYYGNYFRLFEQGRTELLRQRGLTYKRIEELGLIDKDWEMSLRRRRPDDH